MFKPKYIYTDKIIFIEINKLVELNVVKREGQARASYYVMR